MFEGIKGMAGMAGMLKDLPRLKEKMEQVKAQLADLTAEAETGGGAVRAKVNGQLRLLSLTIDPALIAGLVDPSNPDDQAMAEDLITGAVNAAMTKAREMAENEMMNAATDMGLPIPPGLLTGGLGGALP